MTAPLKIELLEGDNCTFTHQFESLQIGRQRQSEPPPPAIVAGANPERLIIAPLTELRISRSFLQLDNVSDSRHVRITSLAGTVYLPVNSGEVKLAPQQPENVRLPCEFPIGSHLIRISDVGSRVGEIPDHELSIAALSHQTIPPMAEPAAAEVSISHLTQAVLPPDKIIGWMNKILALFQDAAGTEQFFKKALSGMRQMLELSSAAVVFFEEDGWKVETAVFADNCDDQGDWRPSQTILNRIRQHKRALRQLPIQLTDQMESLVPVDSLVAAPILDPQSNVLGALYGDRRKLSQTDNREITELETLFVELIASGIASALARVEQEKKAAAAQARFEQFFPPSLARKLQHDDEILAGKICDVSILFCDIRKFSSISERIGPTETIHLINAVMDELSNCVLKNQGVLVDYIGDGLIAMWGAPDVQPRHAAMACSAAADMLKTLPRLNEQWAKRISSELKIGIGINSGPAQVGNVGSNVKFKYGPLGDSVNVASRIEGATKQLGTLAMITRNTFESAGDSIRTRRLATVRVVNVDQPQVLYELPTEDVYNWSQLKQKYEAALSQFEARNFKSAKQALTELSNEFPDDKPTEILLARTNSALKSSDADTDVVWTLGQK